MESMVGIAIRKEKVMEKHPVHTAAPGMLSLRGSGVQPVTSPLLWKRGPELLGAPWLGL